MISLISGSYFLLYLADDGLGGVGLGFWHAVNEHSSSATSTAAFDVLLSLNGEHMGTI
jgi:hypothetical protein